MGLSATQRAERFMSSALDIISGIDPAHPDFENLWTALDHTILGLGALILSVREDEYRTIQIEPVVPVPTAGRRGTTRRRR